MLVRYRTRKAPQETAQELTAVRPQLQSTHLQLQVRTPVADQVSDLCATSIAITPEP